MPFGQLPVLRIDDGPMQTQSMAMLRWVGTQSTSQLYPTGDTDAMYRVEEALGVVEEFRNSWSPCLYITRNPVAYGHPEGYFGTDEGKAKLKEIREYWTANTFPKFAKHLESLLAKHDNQWLASSTTGPTIADCVAVVFLRGFTRGHIDHVPTTLLDSHPALVDYIKRFCALDGVKGRYTDGLH